MNQKGNSRLDAALKMLLIAFISLLAFSSGVYFGKQMSDNEYQLKSLESDFKETSKTADASKHSEQRPNDALVDEEVAVLSDKLVNGEKTAAHEAKGKEKKSAHKEERSVASAGSEHPTEHPAEHAKEAVKEHATEATAHEHAATQLAAVRKSAEHVVAKASEEHVAAHSTLPKASGPATEGEFAVQVASYPESAEAKAQAADLEKKGFPAYPVEATIKGKNWYRVMVGSFRTAKDAEAYRAKLLKQSDLRSAIVQKIAR